MDHHRTNETCESVEALAAVLERSELSTPQPIRSNNKFRRHSSPSSDTRRAANRAVSREPRLSRIAFSTVNVHHHDLICGDNPSVTDGVPLQLDWSKHVSETFDIDTYERMATVKQVRRLSAVERAIIAGESNPKDFLEKVQEEVMLVQGSRHISMKDTHFRNTTKVVSRRKKSRDSKPIGADIAKFRVHELVLRVLRIV